ncbi:hypothetical protein D3C75_1072440 [compost metagenome]
MYSWRFVISNPDEKPNEDQILIQTYPDEGVSDLYTECTILRQSSQMSHGNARTREMMYSHCLQGKSPSPPLVR